MSVLSIYLIIFNYALIISTVRETHAETQTDLLSAGRSFYLIVHLGPGLDRPSVNTGKNGAKPGPGLGLHSQQMFNEEYLENK